VRSVGVGAAALAASPTRTRAAHQDEPEEPMRAQPSGTSAPPRRPRWPRRRSRTLHHVSGRTSNIGGGAGRRRRGSGPRPVSGSCSADRSASRTCRTGRYVSVFGWAAQRSGPVSAVGARGPDRLVARETGRCEVRSALGSMSMAWMSAAFALAPRVARGAEHAVDRRQHVGGSTRSRQVRAGQPAGVPNWCPRCVHGVQASCSARSRGAAHPAGTGPRRGRSRVRRWRLPARGRRWRGA
jgi:hypothetical protein